MRIIKYGDFKVSITWWLKHKYYNWKCKHCKHDFKYISIYTGRDYDINIGTKEFPKYKKIFSVL